MKNAELIALVRDVVNALDAALAKSDDLNPERNPDRGTFSEGVLLITHAFEKLTDTYARP